MPAPYVEWSWQNKAAGGLGRNVGVELNKVGSWGACDFVQVLLSFVSSVAPLTANFLPLFFFSRAAIAVLMLTFLTVLFILWCPCLFELVGVRFFSARIWLFGRNVRTSSKLWLVQMWTMLGQLLLPAEHLLCSHRAGFESLAKRPI